MDNRIEALRAEILRLNDLYYNRGESDVSDEVYDSLKRELRELEGETDDPHSPLNVVGAASDGGFEKVRHLSPMLSLENAYNEEELTDWTMGLGVPALAELQYKFDGASLNLIYRNNKLIHAVTRGNGIEGDDITDNAVFFEGVPQELIGKPIKGHLEIRGEVIVPHSHFHKANERRAAAGKPTYANPRNMVAGIMRRKDGETIQGLGLKFIAYEAIVHEDNDWLDKTFRQVMDDLAWPFETANHVWRGLTGSLDKIMDRISAVAASRDSIGFDIDGLVLKITDPKVRLKLGFRSTSPRWAVAYKFEAQTATSVLERVDIQVGRTGVLTPVAKIKPVKLCGVTVSSVTLHNFEEIKRLDLRLLDTVVVSRRGDVIPKIESVVTNLRTDEHGLIHTPTECPACGGEVKKSEASGVELYCTNSKLCPAQIINSMVYFVSRDGIDVKHLGPAAVESLIVSGVLGSFSSLFYLDEQDFYAAGIGESMTDKIMGSIQRCKKLPFYKVLRAVGIAEVGDSTARALAVRFPNFEQLSTATAEMLQEVDDVGPTVAASVIDAFAQRGNDLLALDTILTYTDEIIKKAEVQDLAGKTVVVTGSDFDGLNRKAMEESVISRGGKLVKSVSKKVDIIFAGTGAGPDKVKQAKELGFFEDGLMLVNPNTITPITKE